jgi:hypothetical protein
MIYKIKDKRPKTKDQRPKIKLMFNPRDPLLGGVGVGLFFK